jgi:hypothetical protein
MIRGYYSEERGDMQLQEGYICSICCDGVGDEMKRTWISELRSRFREVGWVQSADRQGDEDRAKMDLLWKIEYSRL